MNQQSHKWLSRNNMCLTVSDVRNIPLSETLHFFKSHQQCESRGPLLYRISTKGLISMNRGGSRTRFQASVSSNLYLNHGANPALPSLPQHHPKKKERERDPRFVTETLSSSSWNICSKWFPFHQPHQSRPPVSYVPNITSGIKIMFNSLICHELFILPEPSGYMEIHILRARQEQSEVTLSPAFAAFFCCANPSVFCSQPLPLFRKREKVGNVFFKKKKLLASWRHEWRQ